MLTLRCAFLVMFLTVSAIAALAAPPAIYNLGIHGGTYSKGSAGGLVNASGQVVGSSYGTIEGPVLLDVYRAFLYTGTPGSGGMMYDLGALGGLSVLPRAINASGQVVGESDTSEGSMSSDERHAFLFTGTPGSDGMMHDLGTLGGRSSSGWAINDSGQVVGSSSTTSTTGAITFHAFLYTGTPGVDGVMQDLGTLGGEGSNASAINTSGQVVGHSTTTGDAASHAFLYTGTPGVDGVMHDLGTLGGMFVNSSADLINNSGQVVGVNTTADNETWHTFLYTGTPGVDGVMHDLGTLGGTYTAAAAINATGQVVGTGTLSGDTEWHTFLYTGTPGVDGVMHDLGTLGGTSSGAAAINENGQIVGQSYTASDEALHAFLYTGTPGVDGRMIDLDAWLDSVIPIEGAKWTLYGAKDLTDAGLIAGTGFYDDGPGGLSDGPRAYLLDASSLLVVPEPSNVALLCLTVPAIFRCLSRRNCAAQLHD